MKKPETKYRVAWRARVGNRGTGPVRETTVVASANYRAREEFQRANPDKVTIGCRLEGRVGE